MRQLLALSFILLLTACGDKIAKSWIGSSESALMAKNGAPDMQSSTGSGRVLTWQGRDGYGRIVCRNNFVVDSSGTVVDANSNC